MITRMWRGWTAAADAVLEPQALAVLSRWDDRAQHFDAATFAA